MFVLSTAVVFHLGSIDVRVCFRELIRLDLNVSDAPHVTYVEPEEEKLKIVFLGNR